MEHRRFGSKSPMDEFSLRALFGALNFMFIYPQAESMDNTSMYK
jgi:hypothetical protein